MKPSFRQSLLTTCITLACVFNLTACNQFSKKPENTSQNPEAAPATETTATATEETSAPQQQDDQNLWSDLVKGYGLPEVEDDQVRNYLRWYANNQQYLDKVTEQSRPYLYYVKSQLEENDLPLELALLPFVESAYNPLASSPSKAAGIWQFVPGTGRNFGLQQNQWYDGRRDLIASTDAAIRYLKRLHDMFDGDWFLALAAYNAGEGTVKRAISRNQRKGKPTDFWSLPLSKQTQAYVPQLLALSKVVAEPEKYDLTLSDLPDDPYFTTVNLNRPIDLAQAARMADMDPNELRMLNAGYSKWITYPQANRELLVPIADASELTQILDQLPKIGPLKADGPYKVKSGDTLSGIAHKFGSSVTAIQKLNHLKGANLRIGQELMIPGQQAWVSEYAAEAEKNDQSFHSARAQYTVQSGDSLWKIAKQNNLKMSTLMDWNNLNRKSKLKPGQKLLIATQVDFDPENNKLTYHIQPGDTLHQIAQRFEVSKNDLLSWNSVKDESYIHPGQELTIYISSKEKLAELIPQ